MLVSELLEADDNVIKGKFGKAPKSEIEIPQGFKSFYTKKISDKGATQIIGVRDDGSEKVVSTVSNEEGAKLLAKEYNTGGHGGTGMKKVSLLQAFGSAEINILHDAGIHFVEKPSYWEDLDREDGKYKPIHEITLKKAEIELEKRHIDLKTYTSSQLWGFDPTSPLITPKKHLPTENCFIVKMSDGRRYLADRTGASTYIRMWCKIIS